MANGQQHRPFLSGEAAGVVSLAFSAGNNMIAIKSSTVSEINTRFGNERIEKLLQDHNISGTVEALTESEGQALVRFKSFDSLRNRLNEAKDALSASSNSGAQSFRSIRQSLSSPQTIAGSVSPQARSELSGITNAYQLLSKAITSGNAVTSALAKLLRSTISEEKLLNTPVSFDLIRGVINRLPIAKARRSVVVGETAGDASIVALDWVDGLPAEALDDIFKKGLQWDEIHGVLHKGVVYIVRENLNSVAIRHEVNRIASVHPRSSDSHFKNWIESGLLRYRNKKKGRRWFQSRGLQLPKEGTTYDLSNNKIPTETDLVKFTRHDLDIAVASRVIVGEVALKVVGGDHKMHLAM